jgi:hypothetical protein
MVGTSQSITSNGCAARVVLLVLVLMRWRWRKVREVKREKQEVGVDSRHLTTTARPPVQVELNNNKNPAALPLYLPFQASLVLRNKSVGHIKAA